MVTAQIQEPTDGRAEVSENGTSGACVSQVAKPFVRPESGSTMKWELHKVLGSALADRPGTVSPRFRSSLMEFLLDSSHQARVIPPT